MVDCSPTEIAAIKEVFANVDILLCHWHMKCAWETHIKRDVSFKCGFDVDIKHLVAFRRK